MRASHWTSVDYAAVDLETTGLQPGQDRILSFGVIPVQSGRIRLDRSVYQIVHPGNLEAMLSPQAIVIHGIRPVDIVDAPAFGGVAHRLEGALAGRVLVVWTAWVEATFLARQLGGAADRWRRRMIDVRSLVVCLDELEGDMSPARQETLHGAARRYGVPLEGAHHALADAFVTAQLFIVCASRLGMDSRTLLRVGRRSVK